MSQERIDQLGKQIASTLDEVELPPHISARLTAARHVALARAAQSREDARVVAPGALALGRANWSSWLPLLVMAFALLAGSFLALYGPSISSHEFDWRYHMQAESSEETMQLLSD
jgi:hypothetical protein